MWHYLLESLVTTLTVTTRQMGHNKCFVYYWLITETVLHHKNVTKRMDSCFCTLWPKKREIRHIREKTIVFTNVHGPPSLNLRFWICLRVIGCCLRMVGSVSGKKGSAFRRWFSRYKRVRKSFDYASWERSLHLINIFFSVQVQLCRLPFSSKSGDWSHLGH